MKAERSRPADRREPDVWDGAGFDRRDHPLGPLRPAAARWWVVALTMLVFAAGAVVAAHGQSPTYTAAAAVNVGRTDVRVQALPGYVAGAASLAAAYSRLVTSDRIAVPLAQQLRLSRRQVLSRLSATPIPNATMFNIYGTGPTPAEAIAFTKAATRQIGAYVTEHEDGRKQLSALLSRWRAQERTAASLRRRIAGLPDGSAKADGLRIDLDTANLKSQVLRAQYTDRSGEVAGTAGLEVVTPPTAAASDAHKTLQRLLVVGLIAGFIGGCALAVVIDLVLSRRRARAVG